MNLIKKHSNFSPFIFDDFFRNTWDILPTNKTVSPATNIIENDKEFILEFSIPGKDNLDFEVELDNRILSLSLKKSDSVSHDNYMLQQFNFSSFNKSVAVTLLFPNLTQTTSPSFQVNNADSPLPEVFSLPL